jgi:hypothetical protein
LSARFKYPGRRSFRLSVAAILLIAAAWSLPRLAFGWSDDQFEKRPLYAYPLPTGHDNIIGNLVTYKLEKGDTLLDVGRWFGVTAPQISNANGHIDWWSPPVGREITLPDEFILPDTPHVGIILTIPPRPVPCWDMDGSPRQR